MAMRDRARTAASVTAAVLIAATAAADTPAPPRATAEPSVHSGDGDGLAACRAWTDGCVNCQRTASGIACSNIGFACQPRAPQCLEAAPAAGSKKGN
jgi:hypothetical protein